MYCGHCGTKLSDGTNFCHECGQPVIMNVPESNDRVVEKKRNNKQKIINIFVFFSLLIAIFYVLSENIYVEDYRNITPDNQGFEVEAYSPSHEYSTEDREVALIIKEAQKKVFTLFNDYGQGSGFLINHSGDILTNAHVVEGDTKVIVRDYEGRNYDGTVIGYSNDIDIAVVRVPNLSGVEPLRLEVNKESSLGDEVIALGSPLGLENTATIGTISGVNRTFYIEPHTYDGIYQMTAPIAPGSSGGPLLDRYSEKVIGINSARHEDEATIGFSIPLFKINTIIEEWVSNPMPESEISRLYNEYFDSYYYENDYVEEFFSYDYLTDTYYYYAPYTDEFYFYDYDYDDFFAYDLNDEYYDYYFDKYYFDYYYADYYNVFVDDDYFYDVYFGDYFYDYNDYYYGF